MVSQDNFKYIHFCNSTLILNYNTKRLKKECIHEIDKSIPFLKKILVKKNCPITTLKVKDCLFLNGIEHREYTGIERNTFGEFMDILKENKSITGLELKGNYKRNEMIDLCDFLKENRYVKKLTLHIGADHYTGPVLESLVETPIKYLDIRKNKIGCNSKHYFKKFLPMLLKLKYLDIRENDNENKCFQEFMVLSLQKNIFLEKVKIDSLTSENKEKIKNSLFENSVIHSFFIIFLKNYNITEKDFLINKNNFISWLKKIEKCFRGVRGYDIKDYIHKKIHLRKIQEKKEFLKPILDKLNSFQKSFK